MTTGELERSAKISSPSTLPTADKWDILKELVSGRETFQVSNRDLAVLSALISFLPRRDLTEGSQMIVFPSNRTLCERAHGMAESTLRRHIANLVSAGLILRHDSPNGKRYARRGPGGAITRAFGFDLRPLLVRAHEISEAARMAEKRRAEICAQREENSLLLRDASKLSAFLSDHHTCKSTISEQLPEITRKLRRKLNLASLREIREQLRALVDQLKTTIDKLTSSKPSAKHNQNERHIESQTEQINKSTQKLAHTTRCISSLQNLLQQCPRVEQFLPKKIETWPDLVNAMENLRPAIGVNYPAWENAVHRLGHDGTAVVLVQMVQRAAEISNPNGYLSSIATRGWVSMPKSEC